MQPARPSTSELEAGRRWEALGGVGKMRVTWDERKIYDGACAIPFQVVCARWPRRNNVVNSTFERRRVLTGQWNGETLG